MSQVIVWVSDNGGLSITEPASEALGQLGIDEIARRVVPMGRRYKIIDVSELPEGRNNRNAWEIDEADLTDGIGGAA